MFLWINERSESQHRRQRQICRVVSRLGSMRCLSCKQRKERILRKYLIFHLARLTRSTQWINEPSSAVPTSEHWLIGDGMRVPKWQQFKLMAHLPLRDVLSSYRRLHVTRSNCDLADRASGGLRERESHSGEAELFSCLVAMLIEYNDG